MNEFIARDRNEILSWVEPCVSFDMFRCREKRGLQLQRRQRKCPHLYHYWRHPEIGFCTGESRRGFRSRFRSA